MTDRHGHAYQQHSELGQYQDGDGQKTKTAPARRPRPPAAPVRPATNGGKALNVSGNTTASDNTTNVTKDANNTKTVTAGGSAVRERHQCRFDKGRDQHRGSSRMVTH